MGKSADKSESEEVNGNVALDKSQIKVERPEYEELLEMVNVIAKPMASKRLTKKIYKVLRKSSKAKHIHKGMKDVQKAIRKNVKGIVILAGDVSPIDVYSHLPLLCEEHKLPYCYVPSRVDLGLACLVNRATCVAFVQKGEDYAEAYTELKESVRELPLPL